MVCFTLVLLGLVNHQIPQCIVLCLACRTHPGNDSRRHRGLGGKVSEPESSNTSDWTSPVVDAINVEDGTGALSVTTLTNDATRVLPLERLIRPPSSPYRV